MTKHDLGVEPPEPWVNFGDGQSNLLVTMTRRKKTLRRFNCCTCKGEREKRERTPCGPKWLFRWSLHGYGAVVAVRSSKERTTDSTSAAAAAERAQRARVPPGFTAYKMPVKLGIWPPLERRRGEGGREKGGKLSSRGHSLRPLSNPENDQIKRGKMTQINEAEG